MQADNAVAQYLRRKAKARAVECRFAINMMAIGRLDRAKEAMRELAATPGHAETQCVCELRRLVWQIRR